MSSQNRTDDREPGTVSQTQTDEELRAELRAKHLAGRTERELREHLYDLQESSDGSVENLVERLEIVKALDLYKDVGCPSDAALHRLGEHLAEWEAEDA